MSEQLLPHDPDAERALAGGILLLGAEGVEATLRTGFDFPDIYDERLRLVVKAAFQVFGKNYPIDTVTVKMQLAETNDLEIVGAEYLNSLTDGIPRILHIGHYAQIAHQKGLERRAITSAANFQTAMMSGNGDASVARADLEKALADLSSGQKAGFQPPAHWIVRDVADVKDWPCKPIEWIIEDIAAKGNLVWVSADSQTGKTLIGLYNALQIIRGGFLYGQFKVNPVEKILYLVLEDPDRRIKDRILDILHNQNPDIERNRFHAYFTSGLNIGDDAQLDFLESMMASYDVVYLDTYQRATPGILSFDDAKQSLIVHRLSDMTRKYNNLLFVHDHFRIASETRGKRKQDPDKSRTKGTGGKVQNADCVISMDKEGDKIRVKVESKEGSAVKYFMLQVRPKGSLEDKFSFVGDLEQLAGDMAGNRSSKPPKGTQSNLGGRWRDFTGCYLYRNRPKRERRQEPSAKSDSGQIGRYQREKRQGDPVHTGESNRARRNDTSPERRNQNIFIELIGRMESDIINKAHIKQSSRFPGRQKPGIGRDDVHYIRTPDSTPDSRRDHK